MRLVTIGNVQVLQHDGTGELKSLENDGELVTQPARVRQAYLRELEEFIGKVRGACIKSEADYVLVNTAEPIESVVSSYLLQRMAARIR